MNYLNFVLRDSLLNNSLGGISVSYSLFKFRLEFDPNNIRFQNEIFQLDKREFEFIVNNENGILEIIVKSETTNGIEEEEIIKDDLKKQINKLIYEYDVYLSEPFLLEKKISNGNTMIGTSDVPASLDVSNPFKLSKGDIESSFSKEFEGLSEIDIELYSAAIKLNNKVASYELLYAILYRIFGKQFEIDNWLKRNFQVPKNIKHYNTQKRKYEKVSIFTKLRNEIHHMKQVSDTNHAVSEPRIEQTLNMMKEKYPELRKYVKI